MRKTSLWPARTPTDCSLVVREASSGPQTERQVLNLVSGATSLAKYQKGNLNRRGATKHARAMTAEVMRPEMGDLATQGSRIRHKEKRAGKCNPTEDTDNVRGPYFIMPKFPSFVSVLFD